MGDCIEEFYMGDYMGEFCMGDLVRDLVGDCKGDDMKNSYRRYVQNSASKVLHTPRLIA